LKLVDQVDRWVSRQLKKASFDEVRDKKVIRDAVLDLSLFDEYEINVIDLPFVQRLRRVCQTACAYLLYPSATHNRFEHTLGVTIIADKFLKALKTKEPAMINKQHSQEIRLAALLHDVGHGPFSHVSESIYGHFPEMKELYNNPKFSKCEPKPHEILSYLIVSSKSFKRFFEENIQRKSYRVMPDFQRIANIIVGDMEDPYQAYLADIINGAFDSDKLDYIPRDCHFTGIKMEVDIDRIMYTLSIDTQLTRGRQGLLIDISGAPFVEQILFNKMLLYTSIYHHHKVRAAECMIKSIFEAIRDYKLKVTGLSFKKVVDFLTVTDLDILSLHNKPDEIVPLIKNLLNRTMLKRALVISKKTIKTSSISKSKRKTELKMKYKRLLDLSKDVVEVRHLRELIADELGGEITVYDVWIDLPEPPRFREAKQALIKTGDNERKRLDQIFPISKWLETYAENKWNGHVFCPPYSKIREKVDLAARKVIKDLLDIEFNEDATKLSKRPL
jgi:HD superfamily phosphohydrolase